MAISSGHHCVCPLAIRVYLTSHIRPVDCLSASVGSLPETSPKQDSLKVSNGGWCGRITDKEYVSSIKIPAFLSKYGDPHAHLGLCCCSPVLTDKISCLLWAGLGSLAPSTPLQYSDQLLCCWGWSCLVEWFMLLWYVYLLWVDLYLCLCVFVCIWVYVSVCVCIWGWYGGTGQKGVK